MNYIFYYEMKNTCALATAFLSAAESAAMSPAAGDASAKFSLAFEFYSNFEALGGLAL